MDIDHDATPVDDDELDAELEHQDKQRAYQSWTRFITFLALAVIVGVVVLLAVVLGGGGNAKACESAVRAMVPSAMAGVDHSDEKPKACDGLSDAELERIGTKVMGDVMGKAFAGLG